ncbi:MAG: hypothetical protein QM820_31770 [Minicystis sp.]
MLTNSLLSRAFSLGLITAALGAAACSTQVIGGNGDGEGGGGAGGGAGGSGGQGGSVAVGPASAVAEYEHSLNKPTPDPSGTTTATSSSGGSTSVDPNTLYVRIGNQGPACGTSFQYACLPETAWQVTLTLPPDMQAAGGVFSLSDPAINGFISETGSNGSPGDCWGGGGTFADGTLEILSNDGATIVVRLSGTNDFVTDTEIDGDYTAPICP